MRMAYAHFFAFFCVFCETNPISPPSMPVAMVYAHELCASFFGVLCETNPISGAGHHQSPDPHRKLGHFTHPRVSPRLSKELIPKAILLDFRVHHQYAIRGRQLCFDSIS
jgi:hypothetical protein